MGLLAYAGQVLNSKTQPGSLTLDDLRRELSALKNPPEEKLRAESNFATAVELIGKNDFDGAIASLQKSLTAIRTQAAQEMLILHQQELPRSFPVHGRLLIVTGSILAPLHRQPAR